MSMIKIQKNENPYVMLNKTFINDGQLSLKSKGLLAYLLSLSATLKIELKKIIDRFPNEKYAIYTAIKELEKHRYIVHQKYSDGTGACQGDVYHVFEVPQPGTDNFNVTHASHYDSLANKIENLKTSQKTKKNNKITVIMKDLVKKRSDTNFLSSIDF